eukprot:TRINITY_DN7225_c0_g1_i1.p1 TRINITY_DN7225_c0_g1~~TRINITY_DN7225_c0_g1_i1.p1  ORF type:complete len:654 (+),score=222.19 TRINITY_DN7225_c0_g1_i1:69-2030(+)
MRRRSSVPAPAPSPHNFLRRHEGRKGSLAKTREFTPPRQRGGSGEQPQQQQRSLKSAIASFKGAQSQQDKLACIEVAVPKRRPVQAQLCTPDRRESVSSRSDGEQSPQESSVVAETPEVRTGRRSPSDSRSDSDLSNRFDLNSAAARCIHPRRGNCGSDVLDAMGSFSDEAEGAEDTGRRKHWDANATASSAGASQRSAEDVLRTRHSVRMREMRKLLRESEETASALREDVAQENDRLEAAQAAQRRAKQLRSSLVSLRDELSFARSEWRVKEDRLRDEAHDLEAELRALSAHNDRLKQQVRRRQKDREQNGSSVFEERLENERQRIRAEERERMDREVETELRRTAEERDRLHAERSRIKDEEARLQKELDDERRRVREEERLRFEQEKEEAERQLEEERARVRDEESRLAEASKAELDRLRDRERELEMERQRERQRVRQLEEEKEEAARRQQELERQVAAQKSLESSQQQQHSSSSTRAAEPTARSGAATSEVAAAVASMFDLPAVDSDRAARLSGIRLPPDNDAEPVVTVAGDVVVSERRGSDGKLERHFRSGKREVRYSNSSVKVALPSGHQLLRFANGDVRRQYPSGRCVYYYHEAQTTHTTYAGGLQLFEFHQSDQLEVHYVNGAKEIHFSDGSVKHIQPGSDAS